jgi:hypothetical protein
VKPPPATRQLRRLGRGCSGLSAMSFPGVSVSEGKEEESPAGRGTIAVCSDQPELSAAGRTPSPGSR